MSTPEHWRCQRANYMWTQGCLGNKPGNAIHSAARSWRIRPAALKRGMLSAQLQCSLLLSYNTSQYMGSWASWRNTCDNHNYNLYQIVCASVHFSGTFVASTNFYVRNIGLLWVL